MNKKEQYVYRIKAILDEALIDSELSLEQYAELCEEVGTEASDRMDTADGEIADQKVEEDIAQEDGQ